ncbi:MAG: DUF2330 domain-containing protein [Polyangiales bacterium]
MSAQGWWGVASFCLAITLATFDASACGGCVYPPPVDAGPATSAPFIVTDHRMVLAVRPDATILWDQVRYAGRPSDFAWILPVRGDVEVSVGSGDFIDEVDALTAPSVASPSYRCDVTSGAVSVTPAAPRAGLAWSAELGSAVSVVRTSVAGPYEVTTVRGADASAIAAWLTEHGYRVGDDIAPELSEYVSLSMDFVVARLRPGEGVQAIQPLRVRLPAGTTTLPLRMVRAGASDRTGLAVYVIADARFEVMNFANVTLSSDEVTWDFATAGSDYVSAFARAIERAQGRGWVTEAADAVPSPAPFTDAARDDWALASSGLARPWVTRMRTSLSRDAMATDLRLGASDGPSVSNVIPAGRWVGDPPLLCGGLGTWSRDAGPSPFTYPPHGGCGCRVSASWTPGWGFGAALLALALLRRRRAS